MLGIILLVIVILAGLWFVANYNGLVQLRENCKNGWAQIDVQLKRRHDLIPNLVETAKGYMAHERGTLEEVTRARQQAVSANTLQDKQAAENFLSSTLRSLFAVVENYPNLKADQQMRNLHEELTTTENKIAFARQYYNDEVNRLNVAVQSFPTNFVADAFHFGKFEFFEMEDKTQREAPQVKF
jgi:LemA protein